MNDQTIIERCRGLGVDGPRLRECLNGRDQWGKLIHSVVYLTALGVVADAMTDAENPPASTACDLCGERPAGAILANGEGREFRVCQQCGFSAVEAKVLLG